MRLLTALLLLVALAAPAPAAAQLPCLPLLCEEEPPPGSPPPPQGEPVPSAPPGTPDGSVNDLVGPTHASFVPDRELVPPLEPAWTLERELTGGPLSGDGRIYLTTDGVLEALGRDGKTLWRSTVPSGGLGAYDAGRLFVGGRDGVLRAYEASNGTLLWERELSPSYAVASLMVATADTVFVAEPGGTSSMIALEAATGEVRWTAGGNGTDNAPTVDGERVYGSYACGWTFGWARSSGERRWVREADCSGGGGSMSAVEAGRLYVPARGEVLDPDTGATIRPFPADARSSRPPALAGGLAVYGGNESHALIATDAATGAERWRVKGAPVEPLILGGAVYGITSNGEIRSWALDDGAQQWSATARGGTSHNGATGLAAAPGLLLSVHVGRITAWQSVYRPGPEEVAAGLTATDVRVGRRVFLAGVLGQALFERGVKPLLHYDEAPFKRFEADTVATPDGDRFFSWRFTPDRNVRVYASAGNARSKTRTLYVHPRYRLRFERTGSTRRVRVVVRWRGPKRVEPGRAFVYLARPGRNRLERLGDVRVRARRSGRGSGRGLVRTVRRVGPLDFAVMCLPRQARRGMGRPVPLLRRCGARVIRDRF